MMYCQEEIFKRNFQKGSVYYRWKKYYVQKKTAPGCGGG
jgi:hypothetical protein